MIDKLDLNTKAQELRDYFGEDEKSPVDIFQIIKRDDDLTLVYYPFSEHISGMCVKEDKVKVIAINSKMSLGRQRFSLAHELYHMYYDRAGFSVSAKDFNTKDDTEKNADQFATYFLAPHRSFRECVDKHKTKKGVIDLPFVIWLEQFFGMSHQAILWRLKDEKYIDTKDWDRLDVKVLPIASLLGYNEQLYKPAPSNAQARTYGHYLKQVEQLSQHDIVSRGKIDSLLIDAYRYDIAFGCDDLLEGDIND